MKKISIVIFAAFAVAVLALQFFVNVGSPTKDAVRDGDNRYVQDQKWASENLDVVQYDDKAYMMYKMYGFGEDDEQDRERLAHFIWLDAKARAHFGERDIAVESVVSVTNFLHQEGYRQYLEESEIDETFNPVEWLDGLTADELVNKNFVGKTDDYAFLLIALLPPSSMSEMQTHGIAQEFLTGDSFLWFKRFYLPQAQKISKDLELPVGTELSSLGWLDARAFLMRSTYWKVLIPLTTCIVFLSLLIVYLKLNRSIIFTAMIGGVMVTSMLVVRAMIAVLGMWESAFTILVYITCIIPTFSFGFRVCEEYLLQPADLSRQEKWQRALSDDITRDGMFIVMCVSVAEFLIGLSVLNYYGVEALWQIGILSSIGIMTSWALVRYAFAYVHINIVPQKWSDASAETSPVKQMFNAFASAVIKFIGWKYAARASAVVCIVTVVWSAMLHMSGSISTTSTPRDFMRSTPMEQIFTETESEDGLPGNFVIHFAIECHESLGVDMSFECADQLIEFHREARAHKLTKSVGGYADAFEQIALDFEGYKKGQSIGAFMQQYDTEIGANGFWQTIHTEMENNAQARNHFLSVYDTDGAVADNIVISMATTSAKTTDEMAIFRDDLAAIADSFEAFKEVRIVNQGGDYPDMDRLVGEGFILNFLVSFLIILVLGGVYLTRRVSHTSTSLKDMLVHGLFLTVPFVMVPAVAGIAMAYLNIPIDVATAAQASVIISAALDLPLFLILTTSTLRRDHREILAKAKMSIELEKFLADFLANAAAFLPLAILTSYVIVENLGFLLVLSMCTAMVSSIMTIAMKYHWYDKK